MSVPTIYASVYSCIIQTIQRNKKQKIKVIDELIEEKQVVKIIYLLLSQK